MTDNASMLNAIPPSIVEQITPTLTREWLYDRRIVLYVPTDVQRTTIDAWIKAFRADVEMWPADQPLLVIHDLSTKRAEATPYARERVQEIQWIRPELKGKAAIVLPHTMAAVMIQLFVRVAQTKGTPRVQQVFTSREKAMEWLLS